MSDHGKQGLDEFGVIIEDEALDMDLMRHCRDRVDDAWAIFLGNAHQAVGMERWLNESPVNLMVFWSDEQISPWEKFREPSRLILNALAAAGSLVEHTRTNIKRAYGSHSFWIEYQESARATFANSELSQFVHGLRNYTLHDRLPITSARITLDVAESQPLRFLLKRDTLLNGERWTAPGRAYLGSQPEEFPVMDVLIDYIKMVNDFYEWLNQKQHELFQRAMLAHHGPNSRAARDAQAWLAASTDQG